jgi:hypothetical protein
MSWLGVKLQVGGLDRLLRAGAAERCAKNAPIWAIRRPRGRPEARPELDGRGQGMRWSTRPRTTTKRTTPRMNCMVLELRLWFWKLHYTLLDGWCSGWSPGLKAFVRGGLGRGAKARLLTGRALPLWDL